MKLTSDIWCTGKIKIKNKTINTVKKLINNPYEFNGIKRIHSGDPALKIDNNKINERIIKMKKAGYNENYYFIELHNLFTEIEYALKSKYNILFYHSCTILIPPGQCMPAHKDTFSYLKKYMKEKYPNIQYNKSNIKRYITFLTPWKEGQSYGAGKETIHWIRGEVFEWNYEVSHWCMNASLDQMLFFEITGLVKSA